MPTPEETLAARIREYSDTFGFAFHAKDPTMLRPYCHVPALGMGRGGVNLINTVEESDARWARAHASLPEDYDHSVLHTVDVTFTNPDTAMVTVDCGRYNKAGEEYHRFFASYVVTKTAEDWKIAVWIGH